MIELRNGIIIHGSEFDVSFARSSGAGGQNVNKVNTKAALRWKIHENQTLHPDVITRFLKSHGNRITDAGDVLIICEEHRSQGQNLDACFEKLRVLIESVLVPPKKRIATKASKASKRARVDSKRHRAGIKKHRSGRFDSES